MATTQAPGQISPDVIYTKVELKSRANWREHAWRAALKAGMLISRKHGKVYILGSDFISYIRA